MRIVVWPFVVSLAAAVLAGGPAAASATRGGTRTRTPAARTVAPRGVAFLENKGQVEGPAAYYVDARNMAVYFAPEGVTYSLRGATSRWTVKADFAGTSPVAPVGEDAAPGITSFFKGPKSEWKTGLRSWRDVVYREVWPGIDARFHGEGERVKCEFVVRPGADPSAIRVLYRGADVSVAPDGKLHVATPVASFDDDAPVAWQEIDGRRAPVSAAYALEKTTVGFALGAYDASRELVVDPCTFAYCGFLGGGDDEQGFGVAADAQQNAYIVGETNSSAASFPVQVGPDLTRSGSAGATFDAYVAKLDASGVPVYVGYIGGSGEDTAFFVAADGSGQAYLVGDTDSSAATFPAVVGPSLARGDPSTSDGFVAKVNATGTSLVYCGYVGGEGVDNLRGVAVDSAGSAYVVGSTTSTDFPLAGGRIATAHLEQGGASGALARVRTDGTGFVYAGYFGGAGFGDDCLAVALDASGNSYVVGQATSTHTEGFPVLLGPDLTYNGGTTDAFVAKFDPNGVLLRCGYVGGAGDDEAEGVAVDSSGRVFFVGSTTTGSGFPATAGPDLTFNGDTDAFVAGLKADFSGLDFCGFLGGEGLEYAAGCAVDAAGNMRFCGWGDSVGVILPAVGTPGFPRDNQTSEGFYGTIDPATGSLAQFSWLHDSLESYAWSVATSPDGSVFVVGSHIGDAGDSAGVPVEGPVDQSPNGGSDALLLRAAPAVTAPAAPSLTSVVADQAASIAVSFQDLSLDETGFTLERTSPDGGQTANYPLPAHAGTGAVVYTDAAVLPDTTYEYRVRSDNGCATSLFSASLSAKTSTTMTFTVLKGALTDSAKAKKDVFTASGTYVFDAASPDHAFNRTTDAVRLFVGKIGAGIAVDIPAASLGWKANKKGVLTWKSPKRTLPAVVFTLDPAKLTWKVSVKKATFPGVQGNPIGFAFKARDDAGRSQSDWRVLPKGKFKTP